jgi:excisionase family DNA binding protein
MTALNPANSSAILVDVREAARLLSVSTGTILRLAKAGRLPRVSLNRAIRYSVADLRGFVESQKSTCLAQR